MEEPGPMRTAEMKMSSEAPIRVLIVEDDRVTRDGLRLLLDGTTGYRCIAAFSSLEQVLGVRSLEAPDVVLLDIHLPGVSGVDGVGSLRERWPEAAILILTAFDDEDKVFTSLCNGASGYLLKRTPPQRLLDAIREARGGGAPMSPEIARRVVQLLRRGPRPAAADLQLTGQELRLLRLIAEGCSYQAAGSEVGITINTVRNHIRNIYEKLQVHTKSAAVSKAMRAGLI
jgi:DNA-binding NarL/FixJ family response regulator